MLGVLRFCDLEDEPDRGDIAPISGQWYSLAIPRAVNQDPPESERHEKEGSGTVHKNSKVDDKIGSGVGRSERNLHRKWSIRRTSTLVLRH